MNDAPPMDPPLNTTNAAAAVRPSINGVDSEDVLAEAKSGRTINFAEKLHLVLSNKECQDAISWLPSGRSFCITSKEKFVNAILPKYFKSRANFNSFERRLKTWGFSKIDASSKVYVFTHDTFNRSGQSPQEMKEEGGNFNVMKQLRILLNNPEFSGFMWWLPSGDSFCVASTSGEASKVLFQYFGETTFKSFVATMKKEGFKRVKTTEYFGEAVYSHELFRVGRPDLCSRMCRGGNSELNASIIAAHGMDRNTLTDNAVLTPNVMGLSSLQGGMNPMMAAQGGMNSAMMQRANMNMNFPIPLNNGMVSQFAGAQGMSATGAPSPQLYNSAYSNHNLFAFNRMSSTSSMNSQTMADMRMKQLVQANFNNRESLLLKQSQLFNGGAGSPSLMPQQHQAAAAGGQMPTGVEQQMMMNNMLGRRHSLMMNNDPTFASDGVDNLALMNRRNSLPASMQGSTQAAGGAAATGNSPEHKMSILEVEDELLRVKELKLMMLKRKLESQIDQNKE